MRDFFRAVWTIIAREPRMPRASGDDWHGNMRDTFSRKPLQHWLIGATRCARAQPAFDGSRRLQTCRQFTIFIGELVMLGKGILRAV